MEEIRLEVLEDFKTDFQDIKLYRDKHKNLVLTLDTFVQFREGRDEEVYHRTLVNEAIDKHKNPRSFLILGGGDGLCSRNILSKVFNPEITLVDIDQKMVEFCKTDSHITKLNKNSLEYSNCIYEDALTWVKNNNQLFDIIFLDLPDANKDVLKPLYSKEFYKNVSKHLNRYGLISIQVNYEIKNKINSFIKDILGNSKIIEYRMPWMGWGTIILGKNNVNNI